MNFIITLFGLTVVFYWFYLYAQTPGFYVISTAINIVFTFSKSILLLNASMNVAVEVVPYFLKCFF